jgi:LmbE family N-acetylglucosaminyl deacetylase
VPDVRAFDRSTKGVVADVATLVSFHAHPDDSCLGCGGALRKAYEDGHRVVVVVATGGEQGGVLPPGFLAEGEQLVQRRITEAKACAEILGAARVEVLGYLDSGEAGAPTNGAPGSFSTTSVEEAAEKLAVILREENAAVLTVYDDNGGYGHPDHIQVYRVGLRAAELAGTPRVYQATGNRDEIRRGMAAQAGPGAELPAIDFGKPEEELTAAVDVTPYLDYKRDAMRAHGSQIAEQAIIASFVDLPAEVFNWAFGTEYYIRAGQGPGITEKDLMAGL